MNQKEDASAGLLDKAAVVTSLHAILKPFLLRRLKVDVEKSLPPKKEYLLYAPLTAMQKEGYQAIVQRRMRDYLVNKKMGDSNDATDSDRDGDTTENTPAPSEMTDEMPSITRARRAKSRVNYKIEENDSKYIRNLENGTVNEPNGIKTSTDLGKDFAYKQASAYTLHMDTDKQPSKSTICVCRTWSCSCAKSRLTRSCLTGPLTRRPVPKSSIRISSMPAARCSC